MRFSKNEIEQLIRLIENSVNSLVYHIASGVSSSNSKNKKFHVEIDETQKIILELVEICLNTGLKFSL